MDQEQLKSIFEYKDGYLYEIKSGKLLSIKIYSKRKYLSYKQKYYCLSNLIYTYFMGYSPKYIHYIDGNTLNSKIENLFDKKNPINEYNACSYPQINTIEELKDILSETIFRCDGIPNQGSFSLNWWSKKNMPYVFPAIEKFKKEYGIEDNLQFVYHIFNGMKEVPLCEVCNKNPKIWYTYTSGYKTTCSVQCAHNHPTKYKKKKQTCLETYGVEHPSQLDDIKKKKRETCLKNYGVDNPSKCPEIQQKKIGTCLERYGTEFSQQKHFSEEAIHKLQDKVYLEEQINILGRTVNEISQELQVSVPTVLEALKKLDIKLIKYKSKGEQELTNFLSSYVEIIENDRKIIYPKELDLVIPSKNIAIEYCGLYWHSTLRQPDKNYHAKKLKECSDNNIRLITIFEDEWKYKKDIVKTKLLTILGLVNSKVYARKCEIKTLNGSDKTDFLEKYHIQGDGLGSICIGLLYCEELVAIMLFKNNGNHRYELTRYATKYSVVGGFSKLLNFFKKNYEWESIVTFLDLRWHIGTTYYKSGFVVDKTLYPDYEYIVKERRMHKFNFRHKILKRKFPKLYDPTLTEKQNMENMNIPRIYDCGKIKFIINNEVNDGN